MVKLDPAVKEKAYAMLSQSPPSLHSEVRKELGISASTVARFAREIKAARKKAKKKTRMGRMSSATPQVQNIPRGAGIMVIAIGPEDSIAVALNALSKFTGAGQ